MKTVFKVVKQSNPIPACLGDLETPRGSSQQNQESEKKELETPKESQVASNQPKELNEEVAFPKQVLVEMSLRKLDALKKDDEIQNASTNSITNFQAKEDRLSEALNKESSGLGSESLDKNPKSILKRSLSDLPEKKERRVTFANRLTKIHLVESIGDCYKKNKGHKPCCQIF